MKKVSQPMLSKQDSLRYEYYRQRIRLPMELEDSRPAIKLDQIENFSNIECELFEKVFVKKLSEHDHLGDCMKVINSKADIDHAVDLVSMAVGKLNQFCKQIMFTPNMRRKFLSDSMAVAIDSSIVTHEDQLSELDDMWSTLSNVMPEHEFDINKDVQYMCPYIVCHIPGQDISSRFTKEINQLATTLDVNERLSMFSNDVNDAITSPLFDGEMQIFLQSALRDSLTAVSLDLLDRFIEDQSSSAATDNEFQSLIWNSPHTFDVNQPQLLASDAYIDWYDEVGKVVSNWWICVKSSVDHIIDLMICDAVDSSTACHSFGNDTCDTETTTSGNPEWLYPLRICAIRTDLFYKPTTSYHHRLSSPAEAKYKDWRQSDDIQNRARKAEKLARDLHIPLPDRTECNKDKKDIRESKLATRGRLSTDLVVLKPFI